MAGTRTTRDLAFGFLLAALGGPLGTLVGAPLGEWSASASARPGDPLPGAAAPDPVLRRLRPLEMNIWARAHVRGIMRNPAGRKALASEVARREARFASEAGRIGEPAWPAASPPLTSPGHSPTGRATTHLPGHGPSRPAVTGGGPRARPAQALPGRPAQALPGRPAQALPGRPSPAPTPRTSPRTTAQVAPKAAPKVWPQTAPKVTPKVTPKAAPKAAPRAALLRQGAGYPLPPWLSGVRLPDIPIRFSAAVYRYLAYYRTDPVSRAVLAGWLGRMKRFEAPIRAELRRHDLPQALLYVAMIESGFRPTTVSRAGAAGLWQFMAHGGSIYGLGRSFWVDERFNPDRSTRAVMYYLKDLHKRFGSWELALAAYNAGYGAILRAVQKYNTNDYYRLTEYEAGLPYETMAYVPKLFAIAVVAENLERFDLAPVRPTEPWEYGLVTAPGGTTLAALAKLAGVPLAALKELNPELLRNRLPPGPPYELRAPVGAVQALRAALAARQAGHRKLVAYTVRQGDSVASIAREHRASVALLERINDIRSHREVRPGVTLLVPAPPPGTLPAAEDLRVVALPEISPPSPDHRAVYYSVVVGDRLPAVAKALGVSCADLLIWNDLSAETHLLPGLVLRAFLPKDRSLPGVRLLDPSSLQLVTVNSPEFHAAQLGRQGRRRLVIKARPGDTLKRVAARTGISVGSLARANKLARNATLRPGQPLVIYTNAPKQRPKQRPKQGPKQRPKQGPKQGPKIRPRWVPQGTQPGAAAPRPGPERASAPSAGAANARPILARPSRP